ncbi:alkaline phosphatase family protein [uncultured Clostridium sp.]|uniref:alkaline phosphatase family protein n=1 Tax=uncultured Clostridium sp. TaxID=59620 RepID=UPI002628C7E2|nr:alkaline phosphatase family protein [uncultured Clostridium sp.]
MINKNSLKSVDISRVDDFTIPLHDSYCFSNILGTIKNNFGIDTTKMLPTDTMQNHKNTDKVIFFLVDGFGWKFFENTKNECSFFNTATRNGCISKLTTQFPSSTSGQIPTILTNLTISEHGIVDWYYYEPVVDDSIVAFLFKGSSDTEVESLKNKGFKPENFLINESFFTELKNHNIKSISYQPQILNKSTYSKYMFRYSILKDYNSYDDLKEILLKDLNISGKVYYYVYLPEIDTMGHEYGHNSDEFKAEIKLFSNFIDSLYEEIKLSEPLTIMLSADHGQIQIDSNKMIYLNIEVPDIDKYLKRNQKGNIYSPCGYYRDIFLHVKEEALNELYNLLQKKLKGIAKVLTIEEALELNLFKNITEQALERMGNLIIIPLDKNGI